MQFRIKITILVLITLQIINSCEKPKEHIIPDVSVNIYLNLNDAEYSSLLAPGGTMVVEGGLNGIVIYRITESKFGTYERTCPYNPDDNCEVDINGAIAKCPCCSSRFSLLDGSLIEGPAEWPLKEYSNSFDGVYLFISN